MAYRILIVDDSPAMRVFVRRAIQLSGFDVAEFLEAGDGQTALGMLTVTLWMETPACGSSEEFAF